jgi:GH15 family glucan-1,4-alpha-glucosidase
MAVTLPAQAPSQIQSPVYPPIANHGVVGDMRTVALVTDNGAIDWYCPSAFDSPSVFGAILDSEHGGHYRIAPARECATKQLYLPDTNVLITRFLSPDGVGAAFVLAETGEVPQRVSEAAASQRGGSGRPAR